MRELPKVLIKLTGEAQSGRQFCELFVRKGQLMRRLAQIMITLPLAVVPMSMLAHPAHSETLSPAEAVQLLAMSKAADSRCHYLAIDDHEELAGYVARGEIAAAERQGVEAARTAVDTGRRKGESALCGPDSRSAVEATLMAAREAMAAVELRSTVQEDTGSPPQAQPAKPEDQVAGAAQTRKARKTIPVTASPMGDYGQQAMAYYVERRCAHLSQGDANRFWRRIVARHKLALARSGSAAVRSALRQAEAMAAAKRCGSQTAQLVRQGFAAVSR